MEWQLDNFHDSIVNCSATFYVYSDDQIITSLTLDDMEGRVWDLLCNQTGVGSTGNWEQDRKSQPYTNSGKPQYLIFLNEPDPI